MHFDVPLRDLLAVDTVDLRLLPGPHPFTQANAAAVAENWKREQAQKPALFDGEVLLFSRVVRAGRRLEGECHLVRYSEMLFCRNRQPDVFAEHAFATAALVSSDNALIAIRMGAHTLNAGRVYFAAGSFEPSDVRAGRIDLPANMEREVREETGLDLGGMPFDPEYRIWAGEAGTAIFRRYFLPRSAEELAAAITAAVAGESDPEIAGPVVIRRGDAAPEGLHPHMQGFVDWHFAQPARN